MLQPNELERCAMMLSPQMEALEMRIMEDIVRRIRINGEITSAADWQMNRLYELGMSKRELKKILQRELGLDKAEINHMYKQVIRMGYARSKELYKARGKPWIPFDQNAGLQQLISAVADQTTQTIQNITQSLGFAVRMPNGRLAFQPIADYYQKTLDAAVLDIASGAFDYNTVLKRTVKEMTNSGLRTVDYATGHSNRVEVAARRAVMTGLTQLTDKVTEDNARELETDMWEITWHSGFRPEHWWGGRWYSSADLVRVCGYGTVTGLCGANCYHQKFPVIPGVSVPAYSQEELDRLNAEEQKPREFGGKTYTKYEALQHQRRMETTMRAQRQEIKLLQDGGAAEEDVIAARARYRGTSAEYARFSQAVDLPQQRERVTVDGLGNIGQGKYTGGSDRTAMKQRVGSKITGTVSDQERAELLEHPRMVLTSGGGSGIIESEGRDTVALENQRYGRNKDTLVNHTYIEGGEYRRKFDLATENPSVNRTLYNCAKSALNHRSGTELEDMFWIDEATGEIIHSVTDSKDKRAIIYTDKLKRAIKGKENLITIHSHPSSMPPSIDDFNSAYNNGYKVGFVACHNGKLFRYSSEQEVSKTLYNLYISEFLEEGMSEFDAQIKALEKLTKNHAIYFSEVG